MKKNILIVSTAPNIKSFYDFFNELEKKDYKYFLLSSNKNTLKDFENKSRETKKICTWPKINSWPGALGLLVCLPGIYTYSFLKLAYLKYKNDFTTIICLDWFEKISFTLAAKLLKINVVWFEYPNIDHAKTNKIIQKLAKRNSKRANIICFSEYSKKKIEKIGYPLENISQVLPGISLSSFHHQENIFDKLAESNTSKKNNKFFTVGTIVELSQKHNIEILFGAIKKALIIIPNLQLIIVGEGAERKNLNWIAKKMEIDNLVWFVGEQPNISKWLSNFDLYFFSYNNVKMGNINTCLKASNAQLPILGPSSIGLEDFIKHEDNGLLLGENTSDELAQCIIKLHQDSNLRRSLGEKGKENIDKCHNISIMIEKINEIL